jgi:hypothetical protein
MRHVSFSILLALVGSFPALDGLYAQDGRGTGAPHETRAASRRFNAVHAIAGRAFGLSERDDGTVAVTWLSTSTPVAEAFGLSPDGKEIVYMPLVGDVATGELWREHRDTGEVTRVTSQNVVTATVGSAEPFTIAFTYGSENGFSASVVNIQTGLETAMPSKSVMPDWIRVDRQGVISYFEEDDPLLLLDPEAVEPSLRAVHFNLTSGELTNASQIPEGYPSLESTLPRALSNARSLPSSEFTIHLGEVEVGGDTMLGEARLQLRDRASNAVRDLGSGVLLDVLDHGVVIRRIQDSSTSIEYVSWSGSSQVIGVNASLSFTLPLTSSVLTQNGESYAGACDISGHTKAKKQGYAYDFQGPSGAHVLAVAPGSVVSKVEKVTCNNYDTNGCPIYIKDCPANEGWGNTVIYRLSDLTYIKTAHHRALTFQKGAETLCTGRYYADQGATGRSAGNLEGCGAHVHIQRQGGADLNDQSSAMYFSELGGTAGKCSKRYSSQTTEVLSCAAASLTSLSITGASSLNENSSADYDATAKWSDHSTTTVKPDWSEDSSYTTISSSGLLEAKSVSSNKTVTVKATYSFGGVTKMATKDVTIVDVKTLTSLSITGPSSLNENASADYDAIAKWSDNSTTTVRPDWSENSSYTTISSSGLLEAKSVSSNKTVTVKAAYSFGGVTKTATKDVTIKNR